MGTAFFGVSNQNNVSFSAPTQSFAWVFNAGASNYTFSNTGMLAFTGPGIISLGGSATITNTGVLAFFGTAGDATIINNGQLFFAGSNTAGGAKDASGATITNTGNIDLSSLGNNGLPGLPTTTSMTAGSIAGGGTISLGSKNLTVGALSLSTEISGVIQDGGLSGGTGGSLTKVGGATLTLSGVNTYTGSTTVNAGQLIVNGSIASSTLTTVNFGARLSGSGTVGSTLITPGGTFAPGSGAPGSSMTVAGNLAFQSGAFYLVQVNPATASTTNASGTATLAGTVVAAFAPGNYLTPHIPFFPRLAGSPALSTASAPQDCRPDSRRP